MNIRKILGIIAVTVFAAATLLMGGCASTGGSTQQVDRSDWVYIPSVWVEDNPFAGNQYRHCSYDQYYAAYLCPPGTE